jgi:uncharacterized protein (DUF2062 family)
MLPVLLVDMRQLLPTSVPLSVRVQFAQQKLVEWLKCGMAPRQLAFTLALGFAIGCIPLLGVTTAICALLAILLRLNMPAIQAANWLAMPLQVILLIPFLRLGEWLIPGTTLSLSGKDLLAHIEIAPWHTLREMSSLFSHAVLAWALTATPALLLMTLLLTPLMHRVARLATHAQ